MSSERSFQQLILAARPRGKFRSSDVALRTATLPHRGPGQLLVHLLWLSLDPLIRIRIGDAPLGGALAPIPIGAPIFGPAIAEVVESDDPGLPVGSLVEARLPWQRFALVDSSACEIVDTRGQPAQAALGVLGLPGQTAFAGMKLISDARPDARTMLISGAAGAVGSIVAQLAKKAGFSVTGIAQGVDRCLYLDRELALDGVIDRGDPMVLSRLDALGPFDVYFDNVGGPLLSEVARRISRQGLIVICGLMSHYNQSDDADAAPLGAFLENVMGRQLEIRTFNGLASGAEKTGFLDKLVPLVDAGEIRLPEIVTEGLENAPAAFEKIFQSGGIGKRLVRVAA